MSERETVYETSDPISLDTVYEILADERRRTVIACLDEHGSLALADLADEVARDEHDASPSEISDDDVLDVYLSLWHVHIPKMVDANVAAYDQDRDVVRLGASADAVLGFLRDAPSDSEKSA